MTFVSSPLMFISVPIFEETCVFLLTKLVTPVPVIFSFSTSTLFNGLSKSHCACLPFKLNVPLLDIALSITKPLTFVVSVPPFAIFKEFWSIAFAITLAPFCTFVTPCPPKVSRPNADKSIFLSVIALLIVISPDTRFNSLLLYMSSLVVANSTFLPPAASIFTVPMLNIAPPAISALFPEKTVSCPFVVIVI